jgi:transcription elongation GreA/GreB family factor
MYTAGMSRAFVKEAAESAPPPERMVSDGPNLVTEEGLAQIARELARLEAALGAEKNVLLRETLARDLRYWRVASERAVVAPKPQGDAVAFGSTVTFSRDGRTQTLRIVGEDEADPRRGLVSWRAPLAQAMIGGEAGDIVEMPSPKGEIEILAVENGSGS